MKSISFSKSSKIQSIRKNVFSCSSLESIEIPSSVKEFEEGWCKSLENLNQISISSENRNFKIINDDFILGKTNQNDHIFNEIIFARRNIKHAIIPSYINQIDSLSFSNCKKIESIEISENSKLTSIGKEAFSYSSIENICIPSNVTHLGESCFSYCKNLKSISFSKNSKLKKIKKYVFSCSSLESI